MTETGKIIYNHYLRALRVNNGKPFREKKNFVDFEKSDDYKYIYKMESFFKQYPHLLKYDFFNAPYKIYKEEKQYFTLKYFASYKGLKTCVEYYNSLLKENPDNQLDFIKDSLKFIAEFCIEKRISVSDYIYYKSITQNDFLKHLKEHHISWYVVFGIKGMMDIIHKLDSDEFELYFGSNINIGELQYSYSSSKTAKVFIEKGLQKITNFVTKSLKRREM